MGEKPSKQQRSEEMPDNYYLIQDHRVKWRMKATAGMKLFDIAILWYYCFSGSSVLRPMVNVFLVAMALVGLVIFGIRAIEIDIYIRRAFLMIVIVGITALYSADFTSTIKYALSIFLYFIIAIEITSCKDNVHFFLKGLYVYSLILLGVTFLEKYVPDFYLSNISVLLPNKYHDRIVTFIRSESANGFYNQTSSNAIAMCLGVAVCFYRIVKRPMNKLYQCINAIITCAFIYGVILTNKRGSVLAVALIMMIFLYSSKRNILTKGLVILGGIAVAAWGGIESVPFLSSLFSKNNASVLSGDITNGRIDKWEISFNLIADRPFFGYGADSSLTVFGLNSHNSIIQSLVELGFVGSIFFYLPFVYGLIETIKKFSHREKYAADERALLVFSLFWQIYCFVNAMFEAFFSSEASIFVLLIVQMVTMKLG